MYDPLAGAAMKIMTAMPFPAVFEYPCSVPGGPVVTYGLYAVLVHSGPTLTRGHYYSFARPSGCAHLRLHDCACHPWARFDDRDVTPASFGSMAQFLSRSEAASAYMLFYRRLDDTACKALLVLPCLCADWD